MSPQHRENTRLPGAVNIEKTAWSPAGSQARELKETESMHIIDNHDALLDYLYEEGDSAQRLKIAQHLQECAECSVAVLEFQSVRGMLRDWKAPAADLGFRIVQDSHRARTPKFLSLDAFGRGDAGPSGGSRGPVVCRGHGGVAVERAVCRWRAHREHAAGGQARRCPDGRGAGRHGRSRDRLRQARGKTRANLASPNASAAASAADVDTEQLLQRVRAMIDQSEQRQQRELALRLSQVAGEVDAQHQADLHAHSAERRPDAGRDGLSRENVGGAK